MNRRAFILWAFGSAALGHPVGRLLGKVDKKTGGTRDARQWGNDGFTAGAWHRMAFDANGRLWLVEEDPRLYPPNEPCGRSRIVSLSETTMVIES